MVSMQVIFLVVALQVVTTCPTEKSTKEGNATGEWGYDGENEPSHWMSSYPECGGTRQSPINIDLNKVYKVTGPNPVWKNYHRKPAKIVLVNNGHTVQMKATRANVKDGKNPQLVIDSKIYELDQTHFHWGKGNLNGSEHTINNMRYPLEMHAVHRRVVNGVQVSPPEVIVIAVLFELSSKINTGLNKVTNHLLEVKGADTETTITPFALDEIIHPFTSNFFYYEGSLTTPPCSQVVTFFIKLVHESVTRTQLEHFRVLLNHERKTEGGNFRPVQLLNGRKVNFVISKIGKHKAAKH